jgi:transposase
MTQPLPISTTLTSSDLRKLSRACDNERARMRMIAIAAALDGMLRPQAAACGDMSDQALRDAIHRYNAEGIDGLYDRERSGRPRKLDETARKELCEIVVAGPDVEADGLSAYTRDDAARIAKSKWNVDVATTTIGRIFKEGGLSRQKARPSHPKKNAEAAAAFSKNAR